MEYFLHPRLIGQTTYSYSVLFENHVAQLGDVNVHRCTCVIVIRGTFGKMNK